MDKFVIQTFKLEEFKEVQDYYNYKFFNPNRLPYGDSTCISIDDRDTLRYGSLGFYSDKVSEYGQILTFREWKESLPKPKIVNNMKYVVEVNNADELNKVRVYVGANAYDKADTINYPWCLCSKDGGMSSPSFFKEYTKDYGPIISFKDWALMFGVKLKPNKKLVLNKDYTAEVNYSTQIVQVGCQSIPFSKVEELAKLIKE